MPWWQFVLVWLAAWLTAWATMEFPWRPTPRQGAAFALVATLAAFAVDFAAGGWPW